MILRMNPENPHERYLRQIVKSLEAGGIIAYPTDTNYGFGCSIFEKKAIERLRLIKRQEKNKPFSFVCNSLSDISKYAKVSNVVYRIMKRLLPGPYTFILPSTSLVPKIMMSKQKTVGIRVPDCHISMSIIEALGHPIVNTTAALPDLGGEPFEDAQEIKIHMHKNVELIIDAGKLVSDPSTIIDVTKDEPVIIREGKGSIDII